MKTFNSSRRELLAYSAQHPLETVALVFYHNTGKLAYRCCYLDGKKTGKLERFFANGALLSSASFVNDVLCGLFEEFYTNGSLKKQVVYANSKQHGEYKYFFINEVVKENCYFSNGELHGEYMFFNTKSECIKHRFYVYGHYSADLDYLINELKDDTYFFTLSLYGIAPEHVIQ